MYKSLLKPFLFLLDPEKAHSFTLSLFRFSSSIPGVSSLFKSLYQVEHPSLERKLFGLHFKNPVGLAAGFDKDAKYLDLMGQLGFGFIEIGTVTPKGQAGNPKPRLFRLPQDEALINRMGFNNEGMDATLARLKKKKQRNFIVGGNIGKNKVTPNEEAKQDYLLCFEALFDYVDYFVVNVSSPNTPDLRALQDKEPLQDLLETIQKANQRKESPKPILLKIAPDLNHPQLDDIVDIVFSTKLDGLIISNTTISRAKLKTNPKDIEAIGNGGLSGRPLTKASTEIIRYVSNKSQGKIPIIGVGGIYSAKDAAAKIEAGASLVQIYSGLIYEGPGLIKKINKALINHSV